MPCASDGNTVQAIVEAHRGLGNPTEVWVWSRGGIYADDRARSPRHMLVADLLAAGAHMGAYDPMRLRRIKVGIRFSNM